MRLFVHFGQTAVFILFRYTQCVKIGLKFNGSKVTKVYAYPSIDFLQRDSLSGDTKN